MTRKAFLQKYALRFAVALALLGLIVYTVAHAMGFAMGNVLTTPVRCITDTQMTSAQAYLFRNEEILTTQEVGLVDTLAPFRFWSIPSARARWQTPRSLRL